MNTPLPRGPERATARRRRSPAARAWATIWSQRGRFASRRDWSKRLLDGLLRRLTRPGSPWRRGSWAVRIRGYREPFIIRRTSKDWVALREIIFDREYALALPYCGPAPAILDLGSNIGLSIRFFAEHLPGARVVGVEPEPENFAACERNVAAAGLGARVELVRACVAADAGTVHLDRSGQPMEYRMTQGEGPGRLPVSAVTMAEVLDRFQGPVDLVKCDVEGAEGQLLRDCGPWIGRVGFFLLETHAPYTLEDAARDLAAGGVAVELLERRQRLPITQLGLFRITPLGGAPRR